MKSQCLCYREDESPEAQSMARSKARSVDHEGNGGAERPKTEPRAEIAGEGQGPEEKW